MTRRFHCAALALILHALTVDRLACIAQEVQPEKSFASDANIKVEFGFGNAWKLGHLFPLRIELSESLKALTTISK